jgi:hypothetical protein
MSSPDDSPSPGSERSEKDPEGPHRAPRDELLRALWGGDQPDQDRPVAPPAWAESFVFGPRAPRSDTEDPPIAPARPGNGAAQVGIPEQRPAEGGARSGAADTWQVEALALRVQGLEGLRDRVNGLELTVGELTDRVPPAEALLDRLDRLDRLEGLTHLATRLEDLADRVHRVEALASQVRELESRAEERHVDLDGERAARESLARRVEGLEDHLRGLADELLDRVGRLAQARDIKDSLLLQAQAIHRSAAELGEALSTGPGEPATPDAG